jgi:hypothetical protein
MRSVFGNLDLIASFESRVDLGANLLWQGSCLAFWRWLNQDF